MLPVRTEGDRMNNTRVSSQRRNSLHTFDAGICHQFTRISQHLLIDFHIFHNRLSSRTASTPALTKGKERKPTETIPFPLEGKKERGTDDMTPVLSLTIPFPPEGKKERGTDDMTPVLSLTELTSLTFSNLTGKVVFSPNQSSYFLIYLV
jgi:hypothetical protein